MKRWVVFTLLAVVFYGCEKTISFDLDKAEPVLVVDGSIENGQAPIIILSSSFNYFSELTSDLLEKSFIHGAVIKLSNGSRTHQLKEYFLTNDSSNKIYYYTIDSSNLATAIIGEFGKQYTLDINVGGKAYHAVTTIPMLAKKIDSLWWKLSPNNPDTSLVVLSGRTTDPPGLGNYIRYYTKVDDGPFLPGLNSVYDDQIIDGTTYTIEIEKGIDRNEELDPDTYSFFSKGDTATVKLCNIDKVTYEFWRTMEYSYSSIGNPFSSPTKVSGNISGGALGYFGGYAAQYKTLVIPK